MSIPSFFCASLLAASLAAQCPYVSATQQSYGLPCGSVFSVPPLIAARLDVPQCTLRLQVNAYTGCCNTFLRARVVVLGLQPTSIPLPQFGLGCTLWTQPLASLYQPTASGDTFPIPLPPGLPPITLHAQGVGVYVTFGVQYDLMLTDGAAITLR